MRCLDLKITKFEPNFYLLEPDQCGWALPVISADIDIEVYVKYEIPKWTYHDRMHIKVRAKKVNPQWYIGETDLCVIEDSNPSDDVMVFERVISKTLSYYDVSGGNDDYRNSGWRKWKFVFFADSGGPEKTITVEAYWDAESCKFTEYKVEGVEQLPPISNPKFVITDFKADKTIISEGETVTVTATIKNVGETSGDCLVKLYVDKYLVTGKVVRDVKVGESRELTFKIGDLLEGEHNICIECGEDRRCVKVVVTGAQFLPLPRSILKYVPVVLVAVSAAVLVAKEVSKK